MFNLNRSKNDTSDSDHVLFIMWLAGFAAYYVVKWMRPDSSQIILPLIAFAGLIYY